MNGVERFFIALAATGFAALFAVMIWILLIWYGVLPSAP
jgi:hypothetical protein